GRRGCAGGGGGARARGDPRSGRPARPPAPPRLDVAGSCAGTAARQPPSATGRSRGSTVPPRGRRSPRARRAPSRRAASPASRSSCDDEADASAPRVSGSLEAVAPGDPRGLDASEEEVELGPTVELPGGWKSRDLVVGPAALEVHSRALDVDTGRPDGLGHWLPSEDPPRDLRDGARKPHRAGAPDHEARTASLENERRSHHARK